MKWNLIANAGAKKMQNFVSIVTENNFEQFMARDPTKYKALLITDKKTTPTLMKALSKRFMGKVVFGEIRQSETKLINRFMENPEYPSFVVVTSVDPIAFEKYEGEYKADMVAKFLGKYATS